jgi:hypothetical protein
VVAESNSFPRNFLSKLGLHILCGDAKCVCINLEITEQSCSWPILQNSDLTCCVYEMCGMKSRCTSTTS